MKRYIENRVLEFARVMLRDECTVRDIAEMSSVTKSTVHKDLTIRLPELDIKLFEQVRDVLDNHLYERHIRGGEATKQKWNKDINL